MRAAMKRSFVTASAVFLTLWTLPSAVCAQEKPPHTKSGFVTASDGARIHYVEVGKAQTAGNFQIGGQPPAGSMTTGKVALSNMHQAPTILFVPGWTMPEWIWQKQIDYFAGKYRVVAMDPRCQGESSQTSDGLYPAQMARDIQSVIDQLHLAPVVLVGWSMAVGEVGAYVDQFGTSKLAGIVLVDGGMGDLGRPGTDQDLKLLQNILATRREQADGFVRQVCFKRPQPEDYLNRVIQASLKVPTNSAVALIAGYFSSNYWNTLPKFDKPTLIIGAKSAYDSDLREEHDKIAGSRLELLDNVGHALFVDASDEFNTKLESFLGTLK
jgi:non-heme chloroperoxidase